MRDVAPGSLSEGAGSPQGLTEGVSFDGCSMPAIYTPAHMNSETFERLRSSGYTPSASLRSAAPSEREPGTVGLYHSSCRPKTARLRAIFIAPTKTQKFLHSAIQRFAQKPQRYGRFSSPLRKLKSFYIPPFIVSPGNRKVTGDFHRPESFSFHHASCCFRAGGIRAGCIGWRLRCRVPGGGPFAPGGG